MRSLVGRQIESFKLRSLDPHTKLGTRATGDGTEEEYKVPGYGKACHFFVVIGHDRIIKSWRYGPEGAACRVAS